MLNFHNVKDQSTIYRIVCHSASHAGKTEPIDPEGHYSRKLRGRPDYATEKEAKAELEKFLAKKTFTKPRNYYHVIEIKKLENSTSSNCV